MTNLPSFLLSLDLALIIVGLLGLYGPRWPLRPGTGDDE